MKYKIGDKVTLTNGNIMTIDQIDDISKWYRMREDPWNHYTDEMIEGLAEEEIIDLTSIVMETVEEKTIQNALTYGYNLPEGYQFVDENGNVINTTKIVLEKKKKEYPKTYEECLHELYIHESVAICGWEKEIKALRTLLICRDAYWKFAGEEMGLGKPWEPDWTTDDVKHSLVNVGNTIILSVECKVGRILAFPSKEMRDAFYENFKELINSCKELL